MLRILAAALLISSAALAQESPTKGPATGDSGANSATPKVYAGCVIRTNGSIMLADAANRDYKLVSSGRSLDSYVGQEVRITASNMNPSDPSSDEHGASAEQPQKVPMTLDVEDIQKVSDTCSSPKTTDKGSTAKQ